MVHYKLDTSGGTMLVNSSASDVGAVEVGSADGSSGTWDNGTTIIPVGWYYKTTLNPVLLWSELR